MGSMHSILLIIHFNFQIILNSHVHIDKSDEYSFFKPWLGEGLLISTGTAQAISLSKFVGSFKFIYWGPRLEYSLE